MTSGPTPSEDDTTWRPPGSEDEATLGSQETLGSQKTLGSQETGPWQRPADVPEVEELGRFRLDRLLGQGGMGQVWEAWDPQLERQVAVKRLLTADLGARQRFLREARLQATIQHPGICPVFEVGQHDGEPYLVMPCLDGATLDQAVDGAPLEYKLDLMRQVAEAVHAAHQQGLIHRDLKPANILVEHPEDDAPRPVVLDFGIARPMEGDGLTASGELVGTPAYMAPEQVEGKISQLDRRTDVYALGATLYRLLTGRPPHGGEGTPLLISIMREEPTRLPSGEVPAEVEAVVFKCLEKQKNARYDSAKALAEDLGRYLAGEPVQARPVTRWIRFGKWARRHRVAVRVTAAASLLAVAGLAWGGWSAWLSEERQEAARRFGAQVEEIEALARYSHLVPLHDVREDQKQLRVRLDAIRPSLEDRDPVVRALASHAMGRGHLALDELETAREFLEAAYELDPDNSEIAGDLGRTLSEIYRDELTDLERFGDQAKRQELGKQLAGQLTSALGRVGNAQKAPYSDGKPALDLLRRGQVDGAKNSVELEALILFHEGRFEEALQRLVEAPSSPSWMYERWRLEGDIRRSWAVDLFITDQAVEKDTARHQLEKARKAYARALEIAPSHAGLLLDDVQAASLLIRWSLVPLGEGSTVIEEANESLRQARITDPERTEIWLWATRFKLVAANHALEQDTDPTSHLEGAIQLGEQGLRLNNQASPFWYELGRAHELMVRWLRMRGKDPSTHFDMSEKAFAQVAPTDRTFAYFTSLGLLRFSMAGHRADQGLAAGDYFKAAIEAYRQAAELHSKPFAALINLGIALFNSANLDPGRRESVLEEALGIFEKARLLRKNAMVSNYYVGLSRQRLAQELTGDQRLVDQALIEQATKDLQRAVDLEPDRFEAWIGLAGALRLRAYDAFNRGNEVQGLLDEARKAHRKALDLAPDQPVALLNAGQVEYLAGKLALRNRKDPKNMAEKAESLCRRSLAIRYRANALHCIGEALSLHAEYKINQGEWQEALGSLEGAEQAFEEALQNNNRHPTALHSLGRLLALKARRLRSQGLDSSETLARAQNTLNLASDIDNNELTLNLAEACVLLERISRLQATSQDYSEPMKLGRILMSELLLKIPKSPEAQSLDRQFRKFRESASATTSP